MAKGFNSRGGMGGGLNMGMIKQAQKMQVEIQRVQAELEAKEYSFTSGGGMVECVATGKRVITAININPEAVDPDDVEMLQDMIVAAVNGAIHKAEADMSENVSRITGGLNIGL